MIILGSCEPNIVNFDLIALEHIDMNKNTNYKKYAVFIDN